MKMLTHTLFTRTAALGAVLAMMVGSGCVTDEVDHQQLEQLGQVCYLDGAGGGGLLTNWGSGVREGLKEAGYPGDFYPFSWHTGLGVAADQGASVEYKREKAAELAELIRRYIDAHPGRPVNVIGLSAGTAVAVFTLEALPPGYEVDNLVLLGSSLSAHYNLTSALQHVARRAYVYTSDKDAVLSVAVAAAGTADREFCGACAAGLHGFHLPGRSDAKIRQLYAKVENVTWSPEFTRAGNFGGHTDAVNARFVRAYIAPRLLGEGPFFTAAGLQPLEPGEATTPMVKPAMQ